MPPSQLHTPRLLLRQWRAEDLSPLAQMSADPQVMRYFPACLTRAESAAIIRRCQAHFARHGFGLWALERKDTGAFIGFAGLGHIGFEAHFTPAIEIGWRLGREHWGQGFASEAAREVLRYGFDQLGTHRIVAFTAEGNLPSRRVMQAIGMRHDPADDFEHPKLPAGHPLRHHVLYQITYEQWQSLPHDRNRGDSRLP
jgi:RimJ/RimL family protein N-acetyltransferase